MSRILATLLLLTSLGAASTLAATSDSQGVEVAAHDTYVHAINSKLETLMSVLTDDVVYPSPGKPDIAGEVAVRACAAANFASTRTHGTKTSVGFTHDTGKRLSVFHRGSDGRWCAAVDGWSSDRATGP